MDTIEQNTEECAQTIQDYLSLTAERILDLANTKRHELRKVVYDVLSDKHSTYEIDEYGHRYPIEMVARYETDFIDADHELPDEIFNHFCQIMRQANENAQRVFQSRLAEGVVEMDHIPRLFKPGQHVTFHGEAVVGGILNKVEIIRTFFSTFVQVSMRIVHGLEGKPGMANYIAKMPGFSGTREIASLPLRLMTEQNRQQLVQRGKKALSYMKPGSYVSYQGSVIQDSWYGPQEARADGRVVVDPLSFRRIDPNQWRATKEGAGLDDDEDTLLLDADEAQDKAWMCSPYLYGFSMVAKRWGRMIVDGMNDIDWRTDAFDKVVMPQKQKDMIYALVKNHGKSFGDIIDGKGGGCIFLLHGEPGGGKTLLSESVAEVLKRPLYSVSVGELGTDPKQLEASLRAILDVATVWNSVILLDEADIFLEERDHRDIARNAMVGVFLRLLEYHNGVMFMTTNRVRNIDRAFYSRISVALRFEAADNEKRERIWENLLEYAQLNKLWAGKLARHSVNGRQIKNCIRLAQTMALSQERAVQIEDLEDAIEHALSFEQSMMVGREQ